MNRGTDHTPTEPAAAIAPPSRGKGGQPPEIDLDRLVWDPEYRKIMRPIIKRGR